MRVISGKVRGKKLASLEGENTRPTLDRVKESLFNIIQFKIEDSNVLDLFAGSGGLGIEALSRGAKETVFCDNAPEAVKIIRKNIQDTNFTNQSTIINKDYMLALKKLGNECKKFDIIFLDPPYKSDFGIKAVCKIIDLDLLNQNGTIVIETDNIEIKKQMSNNRDIQIIDMRKYGRVMLIFIGRS